MAKGIKDKAAVIGMGCTKFGERWDCNLEDLMVEAVTECLEDANMNLDDIDAFWFGTGISAGAGLGLSERLKTKYKPVTRVENMCATGMDAFRNACYAVISGACDVVMALGAEKLKDSGFSGLEIPLEDCDRTLPDLTAPARFALIAPAYAYKYGLSMEQMQEVMTRIAWKNHKNGSLNPKAQYRTEVPMEIIQKSPMICSPLRVMDCSGVSDGCACAIITRSEDALRYRKDPMYVKALQIVAGPGHSGKHQSYDFTTAWETYYAGQAAYREAGITNPREQISLAEVHDCFTPTELIIYEDLQFSERGQGWKDALNGFFDLDGGLPVNPDGGLKSFGHPVGASGIRMFYESWLHFHGKAGKRQLENPRIGLAQNLGGQPFLCVVSVGIVGSEPG